VNGIAYELKNFHEKYDAVEIVMELAENGEVSNFEIRTLLLWFSVALPRDRSIPI
jgi:hypothetical protein